MGQFWFPEDRDGKKFTCESVHFQDWKYNNDNIDDDDDNDNDDDDDNDDNDDDDDDNDGDDDNDDDNYNDILAFWEGASNHLEVVL